MKVQCNSVRGEENGGVEKGLGHLDSHLRVGPRCGSSLRACSAIKKGRSGSATGLNSLLPGTDYLLIGH